MITIFAGTEIAGLAIRGTFVLDFASVGGHFTFTGVLRFFAVIEVLCLARIAQAF